MKTWPTRDDLLEHFEHVCREYGLLGHIHLNAEVTQIERRDLKLMEPEASPRKYVYKVSVKRPMLKPAPEAHEEGKEGQGDDKATEENQAKEAKEAFAIFFEEESLEEPTETQPLENIQVLDFSTIECYPGGLSDNLRMEFKGEDVFEGSIGYGMFDEVDYTKVANSAVAIFGMGAFGIENVRTCLEHGASKVTLICRRRNIAMPRVVDWFINQSIYPPPAAMVLDAMKPMYDFLGIDVWSFYAVQANADRTAATIRQKSRVGIGDFYFLATYYGKAETVVGEIKRLRTTDILMESQERVEAKHFIKVLGFKADPKIDKLFGTRETGITNSWTVTIVNIKEAIDAINVYARDSLEGRLTCQQPPLNRADEEFIVLGFKFANIPWVKVIYSRKRGDVIIFQSCSYCFCFFLCILWLISRICGTISRHEIVIVFGAHGTTRNQEDF